MLNFIINCTSKAGARAKAKIEKYLNKLGIEYKFYPTEHSGHAKEIARALEQAGQKDIITVGGDGSFHETLNGLSDPSSVNLGFIPSGSGNDFIRCLKLPKNTIKALKIILEGNIKKADYILFDNGLRCLNICGTGMDVDVLRTSLAMRRLFGKPNYLGGLIRWLKNYEPYPLTVTHDGETKDYQCIMVGVCNGTHFGGGMRLSPKSSIFDGKLNLVVIKTVEQWKIKFLLPKFLTGRHIDMYFCEHYVTDAVKITSPDKFKVELDGEIYSNVDFSCRIVPGGINLFLPK